MENSPTNSGEIVESDRNPDGTFKPGHEKLGGKVIGSRNYSTLYRDALKKLAALNDVKPEDIEDEILANAIKRARAGDYRFYKDHLDREHGKPTQRIIGDIDVTNRETVDTEAIRALTKALNDAYKNSNGGGGISSDGGASGALGPKA